MAWNRGEAAQPRKQRQFDMRMPRGIWLWVALAAVGVVVACFSIGGGKEKSPETTEARQSAKLQHRPRRFADSPQDAVRKAMPSGLSSAKPRKRRMRRPPEMFAHLEGEDRKLAEAVQAALDADDFKAALPVAWSALKSKNPEVRQNAVEALGWFGAAALPELTGCLADPDEDVRQTAENQWELALQEVTRPDEQFNIAAAAFATLSGEDALTSLGGMLGSAATEMIDGAEDEAAADMNRTLVLQALVDIIEGDRAENAAAAKEAYNDITGNEWISIEEAERYLADPENYDPDATVQSEGADDTGASDAEQPQETSDSVAEGEDRPVEAEEDAGGEGRQAGDDQDSAD